MCANKLRWPSKLTELCVERSSLQLPTTQAEAVKTKRERERKKNILLYKRFIPFYILFHFISFFPLFSHFPSFRSVLRWRGDRNSTKSQQIHHHQSTVTDANVRTKRLLWLKRSQNQIDVRNRTKRRKRRKKSNPFAIATPSRPILFASLMMWRWHRRQHEQQTLYSNGWAELTDWS